MSMMEAISYGVPVFACDVNGIPELVNSITGRLIPVGADVETIRQELEKTLTDHVFDSKAIYDYFTQRFNARTNYADFISNVHSLYNLPLNQLKGRQCVRCVLSTDDDAYITFDTTGICSYCRQYDIDARRLRQAGKPGEAALASIKVTRASSFVI